MRVVVVVVVVLSPLLGGLYYYPLRLAPRSVLSSHDRTMGMCGEVVQGRLGLW